MQKISVQDNESLQSLAHIDATDEMLAQPFREFLEVYGTRVRVNKKPDESADYHLVIGDEIFVKNYLESKYPHAKQAALILYNANLTIAQDLARRIKTKVILIDPNAVSSRLVVDVFAFLFTGKDNVLDLRTDKSEKLLNKILPENFYSETSDRLRIKQSIDLIFAGDAKTNLKARHLVNGKPNKRQGNKILSQLIYLIVILFSFVVVPYLWYFTSLTFSAAATYFAAKEIYAGRISIGENINRVADSSIQQSRFALKIAGFPLQFAGAGEMVRGQERLLSFLNDTNGALRNVVEVINNGKKVAALILTTAGGGEVNNETGLAARAIDQLESEILAVQSKLSMAITEISFLTEGTVFPFSFTSLNNIGITVRQEMGKARQNLSYLENFLRLYPELAGFKTKKSYLVVFQNSMELRPSGGFIGSLAAVVFEGGRLSDIQVQDVYTFDGQLKGHVDPPGPIKDLLGQEHWYLRDSNWDPDFEKSGGRAAWFYEKETGKTVDGVIAVSSPFLVDLLRIMGPLEMTDYNDRITADNFFGKSLYYTQNNFFPGSTQKKDFLGSLANLLISKLTAQNTPLNPKIFMTVSQALIRGNILFYFKDPNVENLVSRFGWGGKFPRVDDCSLVNPFCLSDSVGVVEANFGVNKANYYINREVQNIITFTEDGKAETTTSINYRNKSSANNPSAGSGPYKTYIRFYLPEDAVFEGGAIDGNNLVLRDAKNKLQTLPYYEEDRSLSSQKIVGVAMVVPESASRRLVLTFRRQKALRFGPNGASYSFLYPLQPGLTNTTLETQLIYPIFWTVKPGNNAGNLSFLAKEAKLQYNTALLQDQKIELTFLK